MKLYAVALSAQRVSGLTLGCSIRSACVVKPDEEGALSAALAYARREWPAADGWVNHRAALCEVPEDLLALAGDKNCHQR